MFIDNKYTKWYMKIISHAKNRVNNAGEYFETHHILPKCMSGTNAKTNLVSLTPREHFICHLLLTKMTTNRRLGLALTRMMGSQPKRYMPKSSKIYALAKKKASESMKGVNNPMYRNGKPRTQECKNKISQVLKNSDVFKSSRSSVEYKKKCSDRQSNETLLVSIENGQILSVWKNCHVLAKALGYNYSNIKHARKDKRPIGKQNSRLPEKCFVIYRKDYVS